MRQFVFLLAAVALGACETMPEFLAQPSTGSAPTASSSSTTATSATPARYTAPPEQQLLELERQLSRTAQESGLGGALASVIDPSEGMVIRPGVIYSTPDEVSRGLASPAGAGPMYWQPDRVEVASSGDMGMTSGRYVQVMSGSEAVQGRYVVVWRRDSSGAWKALTETRVPDPTRQTPARRR
ncbi:DUF4440 domain-containing protein [Terricaulis silvestris]|uniref:DUF4440 domain-containing protein n=1 Tax=Terricaulis silvestris TaxID=2686094 RepID=A0A6I6MP16_9CAUL|nr:DUF4440 domain-containing protein [Terricaulis silvestris]QGZ97110.1 hypothetical protein DSM104635_03976 [Terricaulis silvestris]